MRRPSRPSRPSPCLADLVASAFDAAGAGQPQETSLLASVAVTRALLRTGNLRALGCLLRA